MVDGIERIDHRFNHRLFTPYRQQHQQQQERAEHGVYGYSAPLEEVTQEVVTYLERTAHYKASKHARKQARKMDK